GSSPGMTPTAVFLRLTPPPSGRRRVPEFGFQCRDARFQRLIFLARQPRHVLDHLELLALDHVEVAQEFFGLVADHGVNLALTPLGGARGVVHQPPDLVEKPIGGLGHLWNSPCALVGQTMAIPAARFKSALGYKTPLALSCSGFLAIVSIAEPTNRETSAHDRPADRNPDQGRS